MGLRQVLVQGLNALGALLLARALRPDEFGVYAIVVFVLTFLNTMGDVGLGAGLVRESEEPEETDFRAVLAVQHALSFVMVPAVWLAAPWLAHAYQLPSSGIALFRLVALALPVTALQTVSSIRLERRLEFARLAGVEVAQALVYNVTAVGLVWSGVGVLSFGIALLARAAAGAIFAYALSPWRIGWSWEWARIRHLLHFGLPYQGISVVSLIKDSITPVLIGGLLGTAAVGQVNWANLVATYPVALLMAMQRIYLPTFARMREHPEHFGRFLENVVRMTNAVVAPAAIVTLVLVAPATPVVFGPQWVAAVPLVPALWAANLIVPTSMPMLSLLNALGRSRAGFGFAVLWMVTTWAFGVPGILWHGTRGFALAMVLVQATSIGLVVMGRRIVPFRVWRAVAPPWLLAAGVGVVLELAVRTLHPASVPMFVALAAGAGVLYGLALARFSPWTLRQLTSLVGERRGAPVLGGPQHPQ
jgi:O-antigen/teichoic acid export membrane protein